MRFAVLNRVAQRVEKKALPGVRSLGEDCQAFLGMFSVRRTLCRMPDHARIAAPACSSEGSGRGKRGRIKRDERFEGAPDERSAGGGRAAGKRGRSLMACIVDRCILCILYQQVPANATGSRRISGCLPGRAGFCPA